MKEGKELIMATRPFAKEIRWKSWFYSLTTLALLIAFSVACFYIQNLFIRIPLSIFTGFLVVRMFVIYHDYLHHSILNKSGLAKFIFTTFGLYILAPKSIWKRSHDYHHNHNSKLFSASIGSYPIYTKEKFYSISRKEQLEYLAVRHPLNVALGYVSMFIFGMCIQSLLSNPKKHLDSLLALVLHALFYVCMIYYGNVLTAMMVITIPFLVACGLGAYLFYAQHNFPGVTFKNNIEWSYEHAALESSSFMKMNFFWRWVTANIGYHHIHHMNARIPFYRLPETMENIPELQQAKETSLNPSDMIKCFRLKIWDGEKKQMIPLN